MTEQHAEPNYIKIFIWLAVLTAIELGTTKLHIPRLSIAILLVGEAITKALLVAMFFMHLRFEKKTLAVIATCPLILCVFLSLMLMPDSTGAKDSVVPMPAAATDTPAAGEEGHEGGAPAGEPGHEGAPSGENGAAGATGEAPPSGGSAEGAGTGK